jgi:hypothetical protein
VHNHLTTGRRQKLFSEEQLAKAVPVCRRALYLTTKLLKSKLPPTDDSAR